MKNFLAVLCLLLIVVAGLVLTSYHARGRLTGFFLEPRLEAVLSRLFGMEVWIENLFADPISGYVEADRIVFENQPEFADPPHLDTAIQLRIDFQALLKKKVLIESIDLQRTVYFIDRIPTPEGPRNNVITWYRHMKSRKKKKKDPSRKTEWEVTITSLRMREGTFIFDDRSKENVRRYYFQNLSIDMGRFHWPTDNPAELTQPIILTGEFGEHYPAPLEITGKANFATSQVSFDLKGNVPKGNVLEHAYFWEGSPVEVQEGTFSLQTHAVSVRKNFRAQNILVLNKMKLTSGSSVTDKIWGMPTIAWVRFLQDQENLVLHIPVHGDISSPAFEYHLAFRNAFYKSLREKTNSGLKAISEGTVKLAQQTQDLAKKTAEGVGRITNNLVENLAKKENGEVPA